MNNKPTMTENENGNKYWYLNGELHREDGPAVECTNGDKHWHLNGECHREDGPAIERANGIKKWFLNGKLHRTDGPAVERANGSKEWYLNGEQLSEEAFNFKMNNPTIDVKLIDTIIDSTTIDADMKLKLISQLING